ncbi:MAG TPA: hypothetical protein PLF22_09725 [Pseudomonadales bacterium]|nr:hypothetical protein [Pseudomonadales bacterium]
MKTTKDLLKCARHLTLAAAVASVGVLATSSSSMAGESPVTTTFDSSIFVSTTQVVRIFDFPVFYRVYIQNNILLGNLSPFTVLSQLTALRLVNVIMPDGSRVSLQEALNSLATILNTMSANNDIVNSTSVATLMGDGVGELRVILASAVGGGGGGSGSTGAKTDPAAVTAALNNAAAVLSAALQEKNFSKYTPDEKAQVIKAARAVAILLAAARKAA